MQRDVVIVDGVDGVEVECVRRRVGGELERHLRGWDSGHLQKLAKISLGVCTSNADNMTLPCVLCCFMSHINTVSADQSTHAGQVLISGF